MSIVNALHVDRLELGDLEGLKYKLHFVEFNHVSVALTLKDRLQTFDLSFIQALPRRARALRREQLVDALNKVRRLDQLNLCYDRTVKGHQLLFNAVDGVVHKLAEG